MCFDEGDREVNTDPTCAVSPLGLGIDQPTTPRRLVTFCRPDPSQLGFKTAVGMPFKDIATADSVYLEQLPSVDDKPARTALRRMQEVSLCRRGMQHIVDADHSSCCIGHCLVRFMSRFVRKEAPRSRTGTLGPSKYAIIP